MNARREKLQGLNLPVDAHAGLAFDRYFPGKNAAGDEGAWLRKVAALQESPLYEAFFARWQEAMTDSGAQLRTAKAQGRFVTGLGNPNVYEAGFCLHHTYGVPYLRGSGLKGLAAAFVRARLGENDPAWQREGAHYAALFGSPDAAGIMEWHDAMPHPKEAALLPDILAIHHPGYYKGGNAPESAPADWDDPTVVSFLSAKGCFRVPLQGEAAWCEVAFAILTQALQDAGFGGKTSSGYGRMAVGSKTQGEAS